MRESERRRKIVDYLKRNLKKEYTEDALKYALISQGYSRVEIEMSIEQAHQEMAVKAPVLKEKPRITYQIIDENDQPILLKEPWWKRWFGL